MAEYKKPKPETRCRKFVEDWKAALRSKAFLVAITFGIGSGTLGAAMYYLDTMLAWGFLRPAVPADVVFNVFVMFASLVAAFRTSHALSRYTDAASYLHKLSACWFDSASTLVAFCRASDASADEVFRFKQTLIRLLSLLSAHCLDSLQGTDMSMQAHSNRFEILDAQDLDATTKEVIMNSPYPVECIFQMVQQLVIDGMKAKVLSVPPPILTRSFQDLASGLLTYHEAKKLACVPLPFAYMIITGTILVCLSVFVPCMMALYTQGIISSFLYSFGCIFMIWYLNGVAEALSNPFEKESRPLGSSKVQLELNDLLRQLIDQSDLASPNYDRHHERQSNRCSLRSWNSTSPQSPQGTPRDAQVAAAAAAGQGGQLKGEWQTLGDSPARITPSNFALKAELDNEAIAEVAKQVADLRTELALEVQMPQAPPEPSQPPPSAGHPWGRGHGGGGGANGGGSDASSASATGAGSRGSAAGGGPGGSGQASPQAGGGAGSGSKAGAQASPVMPRGAGGVTPSGMEQM